MPARVDVDLKQLRLLMDKYKGSKTASDGIQVKRHLDTASNWNSNSDHLYYGYTEYLLE